MHEFCYQIVRWKVYNDCSLKNQCGWRGFYLRLKNLLWDNKSIIKLKKTFYFMTNINILRFNIISWSKKIARKKIEIDQSLVHLMAKKANWLENKQQSISNSQAFHIITLKQFHPWNHHISNMLALKLVCNF